MALRAVLERKFEPTGLSQKWYIDKNTKKEKIKSFNVYGAISRNCVGDQVFVDSSVQSKYLERLPRDP